MRGERVDQKTHPAARRRGAVAVIAMLYMLLLVTLALAMYTVANTNIQTSENFADIDRAQAAAESGLRWMNYRFQIINRPTTDKGVITATIADGLWPTLRTNVKADLQSIPKVTLVNPTATDRVTATGLCVDATSGATCDIAVIQMTPALGSDQRYIRVTATGKYHRATRSVSMDFRMQKKTKFAVIGKVPIQVGRDTIIDGPIGMSTATKYPPVLVLSDFMHFHSGLATRVTNWNTYLQGSGTVNGNLIKNHDGYDNRISVNNADEFKLATTAGYKDVNGDGFIDEYDLFVDTFDANKDGKITKAEFTNPATGKLYDDQLFDAIDKMSPPLLNEDKNGNGVWDAGELDINGDGLLSKEVNRSGYADGIIDNRDGYTKVRGQIALATTVAAWNANLSSSGQTVYDQIHGPIAAVDPTQPGVVFGASTQNVFDTNPANFDAAAQLFKAKTGPAMGATVKNTTTAPYQIFNKVLAATDANGTAVTERTPYGSTTWQATYTRPVFKNITFKNVQIPKGLNALFDNCTFQGVTYIDMTHDIIKVGTASTITYDKTDGMAWAQAMISGTFSNATALTASNSKGFVNGNNIRFNDCTFRGPLVGPYATAYTHFTNTWEFTGATLFDNLVDQSATIVSPQVNIEMGSFTTSGKPSKLVGVVVAGNIDIRGTTNIDGSIVVTGDGAGNTTLGYFGNNDAATDPGAMPEGGYGKIVLRYNPNRAMPDGINTSIDLTPDVSSYKEGLVK